MFTIEEDFHGWLLDQAAALRARDYEALDYEHLAEELESMGSQERRTLGSNLKNLLLHLLKFEYQPEEVQRFHSWRTSVNEAREQIADILEDSPGIFQGKRDEVLAKWYERARRKAADESGLPLSTFPKECPWTYEQAMDEDFFPRVPKSSDGSGDDSDPPMVPFGGKRKLRIKSPE
jgi:hypothetical protein